MKTIKNYLLIILFSIISFIGGVSINSVNAVPNPTKIIVSNNIEYKRIYVNEKYYVVFWNSCGLSAVKE